MTYAETFCFGGKKFDSALSQLNAQKVIETFCHNASDGSLPEEHAPEWAKGFLKNISETKMNSYNAYSDLVESRLKNYKDRIAYIDDEGKYTYMS